MKKLLCIFALVLCRASAQSPTPQYLTGNAVGNFNSSLNVAASPYRAVGDAQAVGDGAMSSGSHTLTSASALFTSSTCAAGKVISVQYAGGTTGSNQPLVTTCTYVSATQLTLAAAATQAVSSAGVIWGTDNYNAFAAWLAALPGHAGLIPSGCFLIDTHLGARTLNFGSDEHITMDRNGCIYHVGEHLTVTQASLFSIPSGTHNVIFDNFHVKGEWINHGSSTGISEDFGFAAAFTFGNTTTASHDVTFNAPLFEDLLGIGVIDFAPNDYNIEVTHGTFSHLANMGLNINSPKITISYNKFILDGLSKCIESSSPNSLIDHNRCEGAAGQYAIAVGGDTSGTPYTGTQVTNNLIINPVQSCMSIGDAFTYGTIGQNQCLGLSGTNQFGFVNAYSGFTQTGNNLFDGNVVTGSTNLDTAFYDNHANNNTYRNNVTVTVKGLSVQDSTGVQSQNNTWAGLSLNGTSTGRFLDYLSNGTYSISGGSTFSDDTVLSGPAGIVYTGPPPSVFSTTVSGPDYTTAGNPNSGNAAVTPFNSTSGTSGGYNIFKLFNNNVPSSNANNSVIDFGSVNAGVNNSHGWLGCEYNGLLSCDVAIFVPKVGSTAFNPYDALRGFTWHSDNANSYVFGWADGSLHVGTTKHDPGSGSIEYEAQLVGPSSAPAGACTGAQIGWRLTGDGQASYCNGSVWSQPLGTNAAICSGTIVLSTSAITLGSTADNTATCTGLLTTDNVKIDFSSNPTAVTGYGVAGDVLTLYVYPAANTIHVVQGNNAHNSGSITPGAMTVNYRVFR
jgi:hypothetical protein